MNGSEANGGRPDSNFVATIAKEGQRPQSLSAYFKIKEPEVEQWNFTWYEGTFTG